MKLSITNVAGMIISVTSLLCIFIAVIIREGKHLGGMLGVVALFVACVLGVEIFLEDSFSGAEEPLPVPIEGGRI